jgi:pimeloyl-ACP methyl ester carboxylesterase
VIASLASTAPTKFLDAGGTRFAYRRFGTPAGLPLVFTQHFMGNLDNFDPAISDALAPGREVILFDNAGVGRSTGTAPSTIAGLAADAARFIDGLGLMTVDILGHSMGGEIAQLIALDRPDLVRRLVLVGTGPRGGDAIARQAPEVAPLFTRRDLDDPWRHRFPWKLPPPAVRIKEHNCAERSVACLLVQAAAPVPDRGARLNG